MNSPGHTRFIVLCITVMAMAATSFGGYLILKGFQQGELLCQMGSNGLSGLVGFLGGKVMSQPTTPSGALATEVTNPPSQPVPTTETR